MQDSITTAPTQFVSVGNVLFAYRRFGKKGDLPIVFLQHFTGTMDHWDPSVADGIAENHEVIVFDNRGVGDSEGSMPSTIQEMTNDALGFIKALGLERVNLLAYSLGGFVGQMILKMRPGLVNKVVLVGTGQKGGAGKSGFRKFTEVAFSLTGVERYLFIYYTKSDKNRRLGTEVLKRLHASITDRDVDSSAVTVRSRTKPMDDWSLSDKKEDDFLRKTTQPVLVVNGSDDAMFNPVSSFDLFKVLPNAQPIVNPEASHTPVFQYPDLFVEQVNYFLEYD
ncbi:MAG: alpha/beta hydrolase [Chitinophagaceae bacterium]